MRCTDDVTDALVAQASFNDDKQQMARRKRHSTVNEAIGVAARMAAKLTVLTHFSQRCVGVLLC